MNTSRQAAVLGSPITHSLSPVLHRAAYTALGLNWRYSAIEVDEVSLPSFWASRDDSWIGLSLTMPLKVAIVDLLDEITPLARLIGAVNTVVFDSGRSIGHNTDVPGMVRALDWADPARQQVSTVSIIGAGATSRSALGAVIDRHGGSPTIEVYARRPEQAADLLPLADDLSAQLTVADWADIERAWGADLVVSTLPGTADPSLVVPERPGLLMDVAYDPWPTPLASRWRDAGGAVATGADLLLGQAIDQVHLMTGRDAPVDVMRAALLGALDERANRDV